MQGMLLQLKLATRNIFRHKTRTFITLSGVIFGCSAIVFIGGFFEDVFSKMRESYIKAHTGHVQMFRSGFFEKGSVAPFDYLITDSQKLLESISRMSGVRYVTPRLGGSGLLSTGETSASAIFQGIDPRFEESMMYADAMRLLDQKESLGASLILSGQPLRDPEAFEVIVGKGLAQSFGIKVGDAIVLMTNSVDGPMNAVDLVVKGIFMTSAKEFDDHAVRIPLRTAQKLLHTEKIQSLVIMLHETSQVPTFVTQLSSIIAANDWQLEYKPWWELTDFYQKTKSLFGAFFWIVMFVVVIIVLLSILNTMSMSVLERTSEIGTLMAIGTRRSGIIKLFLLEGLILGTIGGLAGIICGSTLTRVVSAVGIKMPPPPGAEVSWISQPEIVLQNLCLAFAISVSMSLVSSVYPAYRASRLEIADALRHVS